MHATCPECHQWVAREETDDGPRLALHAEPYHPGRHWPRHPDDTCTCAGSGTTPEPSHAAD